MSVYKVEKNSDLVNVSESVQESKQMKIEYTKSKKKVNESYEGLSREELLKILDEILGDDRSYPADEIYDIFEKHGADPEDPEWTASMTDEDIRDALEELQEIYNSESGFIDWNGSDWYDYDKDYAIIRRNKYGYLVLYHDSQIEEPAALTEKRAIDLINKDRDRRNRKRKDQASERASWKLIKELDPGNARDVKEAEKNGYYLTVHDPVYKYADKQGFLHYTNRAVESVQESKQVKIESTKFKKKVIEAKKTVKEALDPDNYRVVQISFDIALPGDEDIKVGPSSKFVNNLFNAVVNSGYEVVSDEYNIGVEDVTEWYDGIDMSWLFEE